jgi:hypothetical protein
MATCIDFWAARRREKFSNSEYRRDVTVYGLELNGSFMGPDLQARFGSVPFLLTLTSLS